MWVRNLFVRVDRLFSTRMFSFTEAIFTGFGFMAGILFINRAIRLINRYGVEFDRPSYWPMSIFTPRPPSWWSILFAMLVFSAFLVAVRFLSRIRNRVFLIILSGIVLVLLTNLIQGWQMGFWTPIAGDVQGGIQYYHDAIEIDNPLEFVSGFEKMQPSLLVHSKTHPPGAVLTIYALTEVFRSPSIVSVVIAIVSTSLSGYFLYRILRMEFDSSISSYVTLLFLLIPSIQIYYAASLDALIASFMLGALYFFLNASSVKNIIASLLFLFISSFLTFGFVFLLPVMLGFELLRQRSVKRSFCILIGLWSVYALAYLLLDFNYLNSFRIASMLENPKGFRLISEPASYFFTRLEGVFEIVLFFGPFLTLMLLRGMRKIKKTASNFYSLSWLAIATLLAMLAAGTFRTGETARCCSYIYPYLMFPIAGYLEAVRISAREEKVLSFYVFSQTVFMQLFGNYFW